MNLFSSSFLVNELLLFFILVFVYQNNTAGADCSAWRQFQLIYVVFTKLCHYSDINSLLIYVIESLSNWLV